MVRNCFFACAADLAAGCFSRFFGFFRGSGGFGVALVLGVALALAGGAWAVNITTACPNATCTLTNGTEYSGYATGKNLTIPNNASVTFNNLTVVGDLYPAVSVSTGGTGATITLKGTNILNGGIGGAGLRVPTSATVTINGPGALIATGGMWRSLIGSDAGAGIGGGYTGTTNADNANNRTDGCGTVIINSGNITAYGGGSGESGTNNQGRYTFAAGIGGSGNAGTGCTLTINGGNVTAVGGVTGRNDIGPGIRGTSTTPPATGGTSGTNGTTRINGGSVNASIMTTNNVTNSNNITITKKTFTIGTLNKEETQNRSVKDCTFGNNNTNNNKITCAVTANAANRVYGITDVKTDDDAEGGKVYFWLPSNYSPTTADYIQLSIDGTDKNYSPANAADVVFKGKAPSMNVPTASNNTLVGSDGAGPYKTGFRMSGSKHIAAIGHEITLYKGEYVRNDAGAEGTHIVKWYRADNETANGTVFASSSSLSSTNNNTTYTPVVDDYGKYIWATICARDNSATPVVCSEETVYPGIQVGVVVNGLVTAGAEENSGISASAINNAVIGITKDNSPLLGDETNLAFSGYSLNLVTQGVNINGSISHKWRYCVGIAKNDYATTSENDKNSKCKYESFTNSINSTLGNDFYTGVNFNFTVPTSGISGDILIVDDVKDADAPQLLSVEISGIDCGKKVGTSIDSTCTWYVDIPTNTVTIGKHIPKGGTIKLNFSKELTNITGDEKGKVSLALPGAENLLSTTSSNNQATIQYSYTSLDYGKTYVLSVSGFVNKVKNPMPSFTTSLVVQQPAYVDLEYGEGKFIVGRTVSGKFSYKAGDAGTQTKLCYYWEVADEAYSGEIYGKDMTNNNISPQVPECNTLLGENQTAQLNLQASSFGKYVRLVVRPSGTATIDGSTDGVANFGAWKRVGVLLKPGQAAEADKITCTTQTDKCPTFTNVSIRYCDISNLEEGIPGCTNEGLIIYDQTTPNRLSADVKTITTSEGYVEFKISDWSCTNNSGTVCGSEVSTSELLNHMFVLSSQPTIGEYILKPTVIKRVAAKVSEALIQKVNSSFANENYDLASSTNAGQGENIAVLNNNLKITFDEQVFTTSGGYIRLSKGSTTITENLATNCSWSGEKVCTISSLSDLSFNTTYKITIAGFRSKATSDLMENVDYIITTVQGPSVTFGDPEIDGVLPSAGFAVGHSVTYTPTYVQNGGTNTNGTHAYQWYKRTTSSGAGTVISGATNSAYTPVATDYGSEIRLAVTPKDNSSNEGTTVYSDWTRVGVVLKLESISSSSGTGTSTVGFGVDKVDVSDSVLVFGTTTLTWTSTVATDKVEWFADESTEWFANTSTTNYIPSNPAGDIKIKLNVKDGSVPVIFANNTTEGENQFIVFTFSKSVTSTSQNATITIARTGHTESSGIWTYTVVASTLSSSSAELKLNLNNFSGYTIGSDIDTLRITANAFVDSEGNYTQASNRITLLSTSAIYLVELNTRSLPVDIVYGETDNFTTHTITVKNSDRSSGTVNLTYSLSQNTKLELSSSSAAINKSSSSTVQVKIISGSSAASGTDTLYIDDETNNIHEFVLLNYNIQRKQLTINTHAAFASATRAYNGTNTAPALNAWVWSSNVTGLVGSDDIAVLAAPGTYSDPNVGNNKPVTVVYTISGTAAHNYTFGIAGTEQLTTSHELTGSITQKAVTATLTGALVGKEYNASNVLEVSTAAYNFANGDIETVDNGKVALSFADATFMLQSANVGQQNVRSISGLALVGDAAGNYKLNSVAFSGLTAQITPTSLAGQTVVVKATATYGDQLDRTTSWSEPPYGETEVIKNEQELAGTWRICRSVQASDGCGVSNSCVIPSATTTIVSPEQDGYMRGIKVYFDATSSNYKKDLSTCMDIKVDPKKINVLAENLEGLGNLKYGIKTYDGSPYITDIVPAQVTLTPDGLVQGDNASGLVSIVGNPYFASADAGQNKTLTINWKLADNVARKYSSMSGTNTGETRTIGTIVKRPVYLKGLAVKDGGKYYDGERDVEVSLPASYPLLTKEEEIAACGTDAACRNAAQYVGLVGGDVASVTYLGSGSVVKFRFDDPYVGKDKIVSAPAGTFAFSGPSNYEISFANLTAEIHQSTIAHHLCYVFNPSEQTTPVADGKCSHTDTSKTENWFRENMAAAVRYLIELKTGNMDSYANAVYGDLYSAVSEDLSRILPSKLDSVMGANASDPTKGSWSWMPTGIVPSVSINHQWVSAIYRHNNPNYASAEMIVPLKVAPRQLALMDVYALPRDYKPCYDGYPNICSEDFAKEVELNYTLSGVVNDELSNNSLTVLGRVDNPNAGENREVSIASINWNGASSIYGNYLLPSAMGVSIPPVTIGRAEYPDYVPPLVTNLPLLYGLRDALIYDLEKYPNLSMIGFDANSVGWYWKDLSQTIRNPQGSAGEYITEVYQAEYMPPMSNGVGGVAPGDIWASNPNYRPKEGSVSVRVYKRSEDSGVRSVAVASPCGADTARVTVVANNEYATIWFEGAQYYDSESSQSRGTFPVSGLEYGANDISYRVNAQAYGLGSNGLISHTRMIPFTSVAKWVRGKSLTVSLDSALLAEKMFFRKHEFDLTKTRWFKGKDSVGTGLILSVSEHSADIEGGYNLVLFGKDSKPVIASCKELGGVPELPKELEYLPVSNVAKTLIATPYGSRLAMGGASLIFNTPNGGTVSIYTMKGELVSRMQAVENRTVVKVPATRGIYIVKLEAK